jgi:hypothetical protein
MISQARHIPGFPADPLTFSWGASMATKTCAVPASSTLVSVLVVVVVVPAVVVVVVRVVVGMVVGVAIACAVISGVLAACTMCTRASVPA